MTDKVVNLADYKPHVSGGACCVGCGHKWEVVAPVGTTEFECPECGFIKGVFEALILPDEFWRCNCGNDKYCITPNGAICALCGITQMIEF